MRRFTDRPVTREVMAELIGAAVLAPSSMNNQPWHFSVARGEVRDKVVETVSKSTVYLQDILQTMDAESRAVAEDFICDLGGAPIVVVVSMPQAEERFDRLNNLLAIGCAVQNLQLAAHERGLGSCHLTFAFWVRDEIAELLGIVDREIVSIVIVGYPDGETQAPGRDADVVTYFGFEDS